MSKAKSIVRMESFPNRTSTGRSSATGARKLAMYLGYGLDRQAEQEQRDQRGNDWMKRVKLGVPRRVIELRSISHSVILANLSFSQNH